MTRSSILVPPALSDLSVTEFLALSRLGFYPRGLVVGASFQDVGWTGVPIGTSEVVELGSAMRDARRAAVARMMQQAESAGAEGVVGVRLVAEHHKWHGGHQVVRFLAIGTALAFDPARAAREFQGAPSLHVTGRPFTSGLSGQDFVLLLRSGYRPLTLAVGNCVYSISAMAGRATFGNAEFTEHTTAFMNARETAMQRMEQDVTKEFPRDAVGVVGMTVEETAHPGTGRMVEFTAIGTAVGLLSAGDPRRAPELPAPEVVVPLDV